MVRIFDEEISEREWKKRLASNEGLFRRLESKAEFVGPTLVRKEGTGKEEILGDTMSIETSIFYGYTTQFQQKLHEQLEKEDPEKANEYLLTIAGAIDKWKDDIKVLQNFLALVRREEKLFKDEERKIQVIEEIKNKLPAVIEKHLPDAFKTIKGHLSDMDRFLADLEYTIEKMQELEKFVSEYLEFLKGKGHMGFLFE